MKTKKLNLGIVGICGRAGAFVSAINKNDYAYISAVCDVNKEALEKITDIPTETKKFTDYNEMLEKTDIDAVIIGTPMHLHVPQAIAALSKNISVFSEVTAGVSLKECRDLVEACNRSKARYFMGENANYKKSYMIVKAIVKSGLLGEVYYAEGEYLHNVKDLADTTEWRRIWQFGINGITYGTHSFGPILSWFEGDRVIKVSCQGSGHHYTDSKNRLFEQEDTTVMLAKTAMGRLIKVRMDIISELPYRSNCILQGTQGYYDSARYEGDIDRIWIKGKSDEGHWIKLEDMQNEYMPELWEKYGIDAEKGGHSGTDFIVITDFINSLANNRSMPIGIHESMDMTLPGLMSQESISRGGDWVDVPDSRDW
jgi:predicted dehydrogenase